MGGQGPPRDGRDGLYAAALGLLVLLHVVNSVVVILHDQGILLSDAGEYFRWSAHVAHGLREGDMGRALEAWWGHHQRPPVSILPTVIALLMAGENHPAAARISILFWFCLLMVGTFLVARSLRGPQTGLLAAAALGSMPPVMGFSRLLWPDVPLAAMVTLSVWLLLRTRGLRHAPSAVLLGLCVGLGALIKLSLPLFLFAPAVAYMAVSLREPQHRARVLLLTALSVSLAAAIFGLWASQHPEMVLKALVKARSDGAPPSPTYYLAAIPMGILGPLHTTLFLLGGGLVVVRDRRRLVAITMLWFFGAVLSMSFFFSWDRYLIPALPAAAVIIGAGLDHLSRRWRPLAPAGVALLWLLAVQQSWFGPELYRCQATTGLGRVECAGMVRATTSTAPALETSRLPAEGKLSRVTVIPWEVRSADGEILFLGEYVQHWLVRVGRSNTVVDPPWHYLAAMPGILNSFELVFVLDASETASPEDRRLHASALKVLLAGGSGWVRHTSMILGCAGRGTIFRNTRYVARSSLFSGRW